MKNKFYLFVGLILLAGCSADPALGPIITVETAEVGAFPRTVELRASEFDLADVPNSNYDHDIDFRSIDGGQNVANYIVYVAYDDNDPTNSNGDGSTTPVEYQNYTQSDFGDSGNDTKSLTLTYGFTDVAAATGTAIGDISPGDRFRFTAELILDDGRVFTGANTESTIFGPAFRAFFDWDVNATCPLPDGMFVGNYMLSYDVGPGNPWGSGLEGPATLSLIPGSTTVRAVAVVAGALGFGAEGGQVQFVCDVAQWTKGNLTAGCGGPAIQYAMGAAQPQDITDDSVIIVEINEDGGSCGYSVNDIVRFTKM